MKQPPEANSGHRNSIALPFSIFRRLLATVDENDLSIADLLTRVCSIIRRLTKSTQPVVFYWDQVGRVHMARGLLSHDQGNGNVPAGDLRADQLIRDLLLSIPSNLSPPQLLEHIQKRVVQLTPFFRMVEDKKNSAWCIFGLVPADLRAPEAREIEILEAACQVLSHVDLVRNTRPDSTAISDRNTAVRAFKALFLEVSKTVSESGSETDMLRKICELTVARTSSSIVCIAKPNDQSRFEFLASAGPEMNYLSGLKLSASPDCPEGRGPAGMAWRGGKIQYIGSVDDAAILNFWQKRAAKHQLNALAVLPVWRSGQIWAVLAVYHKEKGIFDDQFQFLLEGLSQTVSQGLDRFDHLRREKAAKARHRLMAQALASVDEGVIVTDASELTLYTNDAFSKVTGYSAEDMLGANCNVLQGPETDPAVVRRIRKAIDEGISFSGEILNYRKNGQPFWNLLTISPVYNPPGHLSHFVGVQRDITHLRSLNEQLEHQAFHDVLTGLPNRRALDTKLDHLLTEADRTGRPLAIGLIDIDDFRELVERLGHAFADNFLMEVAKRLQLSREPDQYLARVGGDEFVVVFPDLDPSEFANNLVDELERFNVAMSAPISFGEGEVHNILFSMGLSIFPRDGREGSSLMRLADEALYQAKQRKGRRSQWWWIHEPNKTEVLETEESSSAYGSDAKGLLGEVYPLLENATDQFIEELNGGLSVSWQAKAVLMSLTKDEFRAFKTTQKKYLCAMLSPTKGRDELRSQATREGRTHALTGINNASLIGLMGRYRQTVLERLNREPMLARQRYRLSQIIEQRLQDQIELQVEAHDDTVTLFNDSLAQESSQGGFPWVEAITREIKSYGCLPGIRAVMLFRLGSDGAFKLEASDGPQEKEVFELLAKMGFENNQNDQVSGESTTFPFILAWHSGEVVSNVNYRLYVESGERVPFLLELEALGICSGMHVPLLYESQKVFAILTFLGAHPNQFESEWMRQFVVGVQRRAAGIWLRSAKPTPAISQSDVIAIKDSLFGTGLEMHYQPIIDLASGQPVKVEALARLRWSDGSIKGPGQFIPLLTDSELDLLFRRGLAQTLDLALTLREKGAPLGVCLNLPPSTLMEPECQDWVREALEQRHLPPEVLTLELLETQELDPLRKDEVIGRLVDLGVNLAMDDLGSGYSSLRRLATDPFDSIKVDQGLIFRVREEPLQTLSLVSMIVQIGRDFSREVVIEGLEDEGMIEMARAMGAKQGQGFGIARPMPGDSLLEWLSSRSKPNGRPPAINTLLGALTFKWLTVQRGLKHRKDFEKCPLTEFMRRQNDSWAQARVLHQDFHQDPGNLRAADALLHLLVERYLEEV